MAHHSSSTHARASNVPDVVESQVSKDMEFRLEIDSLGNRCHVVMLLSHVSDWRLAIM